MLKGKAEWKGTLKQNRCVPLTRQRIVKDIKRYSDYQLQRTPRLPPSGASTLLPLL